MDPKAIVKAREKLDRLRAASLIMKNSVNIHQVNSAWIDFLMASGAFYSTLEQGAKVNSKSRYWFGTMKHKRKKDPLLKYLLAARNSEEHGLEQVTKVAGKALVLGPKSAVKFVSDGKNWNAEHISGPAPHFKDPTLLLRRVYDDRSKQWCELPNSHLDAPLTDLSPKFVSSLALSYLESLFVEATSLSK